MKFVLILETNHKENEDFLHYCQWNENEEELEKLFRLFKEADYEELFGGHYSSFWFSRTLLSESAVDEHVKLREFGGYDRMFQKHTGKFVCPKFETDDPYAIGRMIDECFYGCRIADFFKK